MKQTERPLVCRYVRLVGLLFIKGNVQKITSNEDFYLENGLVDSGCPWIRIWPLFGRIWPSFRPDAVVSRPWPPMAVSGVSFDPDFVRNFGLFGPDFSANLGRIGQLWWFEKAPAFIGQRLRRLRPSKGS